MSESASERVSSVTTPSPSLRRRCPLWVVFIAAWWIESGLTQAGWPEEWRPALLLILLTATALRTTSLQGALIGALAGWGVALGIPGHALWVVGGWAAWGCALSWLRTQWYTEGPGFAAVVSWLAVMTWQLLTWLVKWGSGAFPRAWTGSFLIAQTCATIAITLLWERHASRWIHLDVRSNDGLERG